MSKSQKKLERAFKLIKRDKTDEALKILHPVVEAEPENIDAWWLLAYASTEPREVREALLQVLRLDPNYTNAPKARDMLERLNQEYPPDADEMAAHPELQTTAFPDVFETDDDIFSDTAFGSETESFEAEPGDVSDPFAEDLFGDAFEEPLEFEQDVDDVFAEEDPFAETVDAPFMSEDLTSDFEDEADAVFVPQEPRRITLEPEPLDEEAQAALDERTFRRSERGRRLFRLFAGLVLIAAVVAALLLVVSLGTDDEQEDPAELNVLEVESDAVQNALTAVQSQLQNTGVNGDSRALVAKSSLGDTLYAQVCASPDRELPQIVVENMEIVANQAASVVEDLDAVGVTVTTCDGDKRDTLYRAFVSIDDVIRYLNGELDDGTGDASLVLARFQELWETP